MPSVYPVSVITILPGNGSFAVIALTGGATGTRVDHQGGSIDVVARTSEYGASSSSWVFDIPNKYRVNAVNLNVAEDVTTLESFAALALGSYVDIYVKRSSNATTYDRVVGAVFAGQPKELPEDGNAHRMFQLTWTGGVFTAGIAAGLVPTYA